MDEQHRQALHSLRDKIRAVCVHDQAQWDTTWKAALSDPNISRHGLIEPGAFFDVLEANSVLLGRSDVRLLMWQFQEPNEAVAAAKFLRWVALNAPADHVNPDVRFPHVQLPEPYRRIRKVWDQAFEAAWSVITTQSAKYKAENLTTKSSNRPLTPSQQQPTDYDAAKSHACDPTRQIALTSECQVVGLASHCLLPLLVVALNYDAAKDPTTIAAPSLRFVSTTSEFKELGEFAVTFPLDNPATADAASVHLSIQGLSSLQLTNDSRELFDCCVAVHLVETTTISDLEAPDTNVATTSTTRECINVYGIEFLAAQVHECNCQLIAVINPAQGVSSIVLSPDSAFIAITSLNTSVIYRVKQGKRGQDRELQPQPLVSPAFCADLETTRSPFGGGNYDPMVHYLVMPVTSRSEFNTTPRSRSSVYAFVVCCGLNVFKYLLPPPTASNASSATLAPTKTWEHLSNATSSALDATTQYFVVGFDDGTIVVWDVLQDTNYAFCSPFDSAKGTLPPLQNASSSVEITSVMVCHNGYVVALSNSAQRLYFFDVRDRGCPSLKRVVEPTYFPATQSAPAAVLMVSLATTSSLPVVLVEHSDGMVVLFDARTAEAIGSLSVNSASVSPKWKNKSCLSIAGNQDVLGIAGSSDASEETGLELYTWRDVLLTCFPFFSDELQQRDEELTNPTVTNLFRSNADDNPATIPSQLLSVVDTSETLETILLQMAGALPNAGGSSSLQSPNGRSSVPNLQSGVSLSSQPSNEGNRSLQYLDTTTTPDVLLEPLVQDDGVFFQQYCRQYLDSAAIADKENRLHRKRRELLKAMSAAVL